MGPGITWSTLVDDWQWPPTIASPLSYNYLTKDGKWLALCCLEAGRYWAPLCELLGRPELASDSRFADLQSLLANSADATAILRDAFSQRTLDEWRGQLENFEGQWTVVQDALQAGVDPQAIANGYIQGCQSGTGVSYKLVAPPVQFNEEPATSSRAPEFNEHGDSILADLGINWEDIIDLKIRGIVG
jgi:crotonobetainyl-CoA:carnitine CoA-transferase CaiB-like acyl-CoA transferase